MTVAVASGRDSDLRLLFILFELAGRCTSNNELRVTELSVEGGLNSICGGSGILVEHVLHEDRLPFDLRTWDLLRLQMGLNGLSLLSTATTPTSTSSATHGKATSVYSTPFGIHSEKNAYRQQSAQSNKTSHC